MNIKDFTLVQDGFFEDVHNVHRTKGTEYANSEDRFANFNRLSQRLGVSRETVLWVYLTKHLDSIEHFIRTKYDQPSEPIRGRIVDAINYLTLLGGMLEEDHRNSASGALKNLLQAEGVRVEELHRTTARNAVDQALGETLTEDEVEDIRKSICESGGSLNVRP